ncbi:uncharacterized protein LOC104664690 isoform X2 [Rhinopithecus roxellana]|uniref:uncharacterized protein LOC104664690 isoform X2 n=1 Tax=Rhinopithecus roxellana TaxID=61622 RepID=UPI0012378BC9|nr:uncharacterized protein LOC104664690 isoform X2 [Rhinopithecus roxellana]
MAAPAQVVLAVEELGSASLCTGIPLGLWSGVWLSCFAPECTDCAVLRCIRPQGYKVLRLLHIRPQELPVGTRLPCHTVSLQPVVDAQGGAPTDAVTWCFLEPMLGARKCLPCSSRLHGCSVVAADLFPGEACERAGRLGALHSPVMLLPGSLVFNRSAEPPCRRLPCNRAVRARAQACLGKTWVSLCPGNTTAGLRGERGRSGRRKVGLRMVWTTCGQRAAWVERSLPLWEPSAGWSIPSRRLALPWVHEDGASRPVVQQPCFLPQSFLIDGFLGIPDSHGSVIPALEHRPPTEGTLPTEDQRADNGSLESPRRSSLTPPDNNHTWNWRQGCEEELPREQGGSRQLCQEPPGLGRRGAAQGPDMHSVPLERRLQPPGLWDRSLVSRRLGAPPACALLSPHW